MERIWTLQEIADDMHKSLQFVYWNCKNGKLEAFTKKHGMRDRWFVPEKAYLKFLKQEGYADLYTKNYRQYMVRAVSDEVFSQEVSKELAKKMVICYQRNTDKYGNTPIILKTFTSEYET